MGQPEDVLRDPRFQPFLAEDFDPSAFASRALAQAQSTAQEQAEALQSGIQLLDAQLRHEVLRRRDELVGQASRLGEAEASVQRIALSVRSLQAVAARVRADVGEPYAQIAERTWQLANVQRTVELLRHLTHRLKLMQRLRVQMAVEGAGILEVAKAAKLLSEVQAVDAESGLAGVGVVDADTQFLAAAAARVRSRADEALKAGLATLSQADVGSALQVLYNLGELRPAVEAHVDTAAAATERAMLAALDARRLTAGAVAAGGGRALATAPSGGAAGKVQEVLWGQLADALGALRRTALEAWHLQRVLRKKRDPLCGELFIDVVAPADKEGAELPLDRFWQRVAQGLSGAFSSAFATPRGGLVRDTLVSGYPRLAAALEAELAGALADSRVGGGAEPALGDAHVAAVLDAPSDLRAAYLAGVVGRLAEAASSAFPGAPGGRLPGAADLQKCVARAHEELAAGAAGGARTAAAVAEAVGGALLLLAERAERMAATGPDLRSVTGACNASQQRNIALCNALQELHRALAALAPRLPEAAVLQLREPLRALQAVAVESVAPLLRALAEAGEGALLRMHGQDWAGEAGGGVVETSPHMLALGRLLANARVEYLSKFSPPPSGPTSSAASGGGLTVARSLVERLAARLLLFFVRHAALLRPLSQAGKLQLAKDMAELESAVGASLLPAEAVGAPLRALRALRRLLFTETPDVRGSAWVADLYRPALLHHLFSRAPAALQSPHARSGLTPAQYSLWLDGHSETEAVRFVRTALDACAPRAAGQPGAAELLPLLRELCGAA